MKTQVYVHTTIYETALVQWCYIDFMSIRGVDGVNLPWVYGHTAIYETYLVQWCYINGLSIRGGVGSICHGYMCILLYTLLILCGGFPEIYAELEEKVGSVCHDDLGICALYYMSSCFGIDALVIQIYCRSEEWGGVILPWVYVPSDIYETYLVQWCCIYLLSIGGGDGGSVYHGYMCLLLYQNLFGVVVFQRSILNWRMRVESVCHEDLGICAFQYI